MSCADSVSGHIAGAPRDLQVITAGIGVQIEHLSGKIQPRHPLGCHGAGIDLLDRHAAGGDDRLTDRARTAHGDREMLKQFHELVPLFARDSVDLRILRNTGQVKPDLVAPGVDITSCAVGGGYESRSGTSMAAPFVSGSCALLMQWGILQNNDPFLYGEKMKAYLIRGARQLPFSVSYPNPQSGYGALCVSNSLTFV